jgi:hypothetical protein
MSAQVEIAWPTLEEVEAADATQLARWYRFLPSPAGVEEGRRMTRIIARFIAAGGMTPELSKAIGLKPRGVRT